MRRTIKIILTLILAMLICSETVQPVMAASKTSQTTKKVVKPKWVKIGKKYKYLNKNNTYSKSKFQTISNKKYYFNKSGFMVTGWNTIKNDKYYFDKNGVLQKNKWIGKYYVSSEGVYIKGLEGKNGNQGRISIPSVGYSMPLYSGGNWQKIVDNKDSALFVNFFGKQMLADHAAQGLKKMKNCKKGDKLYIVKNKKVTTYVMTKIYKNGINSGNGIKIGNKYADEMNDGDLFMYCCNDASGKSVTVTFWKKIK